MMYKANTAVCSEIRAKRTQRKASNNVEFFEYKPWWYANKPLGFKRLS
jgi:hypothetical protein